MKAVLVGPKKVMRIPEEEAERLKPQEYEPK